MSSEPLVLISHCPADTESARRLADSLALAGFETQCKTGYTTAIKDQIEACVLFIPVISNEAASNKSSTFRIAWNVTAGKIESLKVAATFVLPVVVDNTSDYKTIVPKAFRTLPWLRESKPKISKEFVELAGRMAACQSKPVGFPPIPSGESLPPFAFSPPEPAPAPAPTPEPTPTPASTPASEPATLESNSKWRWIGAVGVIVLITGIFLWLRPDQTEEVETTPIAAQSTVPGPTNNDLPAPVTELVDAPAPETPSPVTEATEETESIVVETTDEPAATPLETLTARKTEPTADPDQLLNRARSDFSLRLDPDEYVATVRFIVDSVPEMEWLPPTVLGLLRDFPNQRQAIRAGSGKPLTAPANSGAPPEIALTYSYLDQGNYTLAQHFARVAQKALAPSMAANEALERHVEIFSLMAIQDPQAISLLEEIPDRSDSYELLLVRSLIYQGENDRALSHVESLLSRPRPFDLATVLYFPPFERLHGHKNFKATLSAFATDEQINDAIAWVAARTGN